MRFFSRCDSNAISLNHSLRPKRTALHKVDQAARKPVCLFYFPSAGDTAFPSFVRLSEHKLLIANQTSRRDTPDIRWLQGQGSPPTTRICLATPEFCYE